MGVVVIKRLALIKDRTADISEDVCVDMVLCTMAFVYEFVGVFDCVYVPPFTRRLAVFFFF